MAYSLLICRKRSSRILQIPFVTATMTREYKKPAVPSGVVPARLPPRDDHDRGIGFAAPLIMFSGVRLPGSRLTSRARRSEVNLRVRSDVLLILGELIQHDRYSNAWPWPRTYSAGSISRQSTTVSSGSADQRRFVIHMPPNDLSLRSV